MSLPSLLSPLCTRVQKKSADQRLRRIRFQALKMAENEWRDIARNAGTWCSRSAVRLVISSH